jgi:MEMO1 family protein
MRHLPFIHKIMVGKEFKLVPLLVGSLYKNAEVTYAELLLPYFKDPSTLFIFSSDFCHWGLCD